MSYYIDIYLITIIIFTCLLCILLIIFICFEINLYFQTQNETKIINTLNMWKLTIKNNLPCNTLYGYNNNT